MDPRAPRDTFTKIYLFLWGLCVLAVFIALIFYKFGFRLTSGFEPVKVTAVELFANEKDLQIFMDNRERRVPFLNGRYTIQNVIPGLHSILVSKNGFWPWAKTVAITQNNVRTLYAFVFPMDGAEVKPLSPAAPEFAAAEKSLKNSPLSEPKPNSPALLPEMSVAGWIMDNIPNRRLSSDKSTALYVKDGTIYVAWISDSEPPPHYFCEENPCKLVMPVTVSSEPLQSVDFYKGRRDVVLFAAGTTIYGIEVDREGTQNFQPLYKGVQPSFYETPEGMLYIKDGSSILSTTL